MNTHLLLKRLLLLWVFAFSFSLWGQTTSTYTFTTKSWGATPTDWTSGKDGLAFQANQGIQITTATSGAFGNSPLSFSAISSVKVYYTTNATKGAGTITPYAVGSTSATAQSGTAVAAGQSVTTSGGTSVRSLTFTPTAAITGFLQLYVTCTANSIYIHSVDITYGAPTGPAITATPASLSGFTYIEGSGPSAEQSFTVNGSNLTDNITVTAPANFEVSTTSGSDFRSSVTLTQTGGTVASTTIYARMVAGLAVNNNYSGDVVLSSIGATAVNVGVSGEVTAIPLGTPVATPATNITADAFMANWDAVPDATNYELDVYTGTNAPATTITETFTNIGGGTSSSYSTRTWTGDGSIAWNAYKARTDQVVNTGNDALTLQDASDAYLESGVIANGLSNISFDVKQVFGGSGGVLTVKVLTGPTFATVTTIGTKPYNTTASTYNSGVISGITGDYKILIENNASARPAIDNLRFTGLPTSTKTFVSGYENLSVGNVTSYDVTGLDSGTKYNYVVRAKSGATTSVNSNEISVTTLGPITWNGTAWSNESGPSASLDAIIDADYSGPSFIARALTVNTTKTLTVNTFVKADDVINKGAIILADNSSFIQTPGGTYSGSGTFTVNRNSISPVNKYAFWSSPIVNQNMFAIFPGYTAAYVMTYNTATNFYDTLINPALGTPGVGYSIKTPAAAPSAQFLGAPNNGVVNISLSTAADKYNLVGNPYPSSLDLRAFYTLNNANITPTLYFWDNTGGSATTQTGETAVNSGYAIYNASGSGTWNKAPNGSANPTEDYAKTGQGFIVEALTNTLKFDNTLRVANAGENFNKNSTATAGEGKYWLTLTTSYNAKITQAITYENGASSDLDAYDSKAMDLGADAFYSFVGTEKVVIQGKAPFNDDDLVILGNRHFDTGNFQIALTQKEGLFTEGQAIYLKDKLAGIYVNLQDGPYSFSSNAGEFGDRFEVVYRQPTLATGSTVKAGLVVYRNGEDFVIDSPSKIESVEVYDASGRLVKTVKAKSNKETVTNLSSGVFILKIKTTTEQVSKKVIK